MNSEVIKTKLMGFGMSVNEGIDPNPENYVSAGIVHTRTAQIGCLLRLEPNKQAQMFRLTIRSSKDEVATKICEMFASQI